MLKPIQLFGVGNEGKSPNVDAQSRVNLYSEIDIESGTLKLYPTPGLTVFANLGANPARGWYTPESRDVSYVVSGTNLWELANDGTATFRGSLATATGRVEMVDNGLQLLIVDGSFGYILTFATNVLASIGDADFEAADTCAFLNGFFIVGRTDSAEWAISALYDGTSWDALDFATAESSPGDLLRVWVENGTILLFKGRTTEFWGESGAADFPFARIGSSAIEWGLAARWSLVKYMDSLAFLRKNRLGAVQACVLTGYSATVISNAEIDHLFSTYTVENATAFAYMVSGHPMVCFNFPTDNVSWEYDGKTNEWHQRQSGMSGRYRGEIQTNFLNQPYVSDYANGMLYLIDQDAYTDNGETIVREFTTRHVKTGDRSRIAQLWLEMEGGVGLQTGQGTDPQVMLRISRDGGHTWSGELWRDIGAVGKYTARAVWNRLGQARDWVFRWRVTDPVKTVFVGAWMRSGDGR